MSFTSICFQMKSARRPNHYSDDYVWKKHIIIQFKSLILFLEKEHAFICFCLLKR